MADKNETELDTKPYLDKALRDWAYISLHPGPDISARTAALLVLAARIDELQEAIWQNK